MAGFEELDTAIDPSSLPPQIEADQVAWDGDKMDDRDALAIVLHDVSTAEQFIQGKNMVLDWERADANYRAFGLPRNWPGVESQRSGLNVPVIMEAAQKLVAAIMLALFSDKQPFMLEAIGPVKPAALRAKQKLLMWAIQLSGFKEEIRKMLLAIIVYGWCAGRWGWKTSRISSKKYEMSPTGNGKVKRVIKDYEISHPTFEAIEIRNILVDPALREQDIRKARFVIAQMYTDADGLDDLRADSAYKNIPSREELAAILSRGEEAATDSLAGSKQQQWRDNQAAKETDKPSLDPLKAPLELLEYVTDDRVITVLQRKIVIRNEASEFGRKTYLSCAFIDVPGAMYGFGVSKLLSGEQYLQTSVLNSWLDVVALKLNPGFTSEQGLQTTSQNVKLSPGKILTGPKLTPIAIPDVGAEALTVLQTSENRANRRVGANGGDNLPTQALRTAEGVNSFNQGVVDKLQYFIENFSEMVFIPTLEAFLDICQDNLQPDDIQRILTEMDGKAYEESILDIYNARCTVQVLASTKLATRRAIVQILPLLAQLLQVPGMQDSLTAQGKKFDLAEFLEEVTDAIGWNVNNLIVPMTQEELQRAMSIQSPEQVKAQMEMAKMQQQNANTLQQIEATGVMRAGVNIVSHGVKTAMEPQGE